jgi:hypothetical protein
MTDDTHTTDGGIDSDRAENTSGRDSTGGHGDPVSSGVDISRRTFIQGAAASAVGAGAVSTLGGSAEAAGSQKRLVVAGKGTGQHTYDIRMEKGGSIAKASHAGSNDSTGVTHRGRPQADGEVWHWNADSYVYQGTVHSVEVDGTVSVHFPDGAFVPDERLAVSGEGAGDHSYEVGTDSGDIDLVSETTWTGDETDHGGSTSENNHSYDMVSGRVVDTGADTLTIGGGQPVQYVRVDDGHAQVSAYRSGRSAGGGSQGEASILLCYMGDSQFTTFFQNLQNLNPAVTGYDQSILLKHTGGASAIGGVAHTLADKVEKPTRENFESCIRKLAAAGYTIDLYIVSHGDRDSFKMSEGTHGSEDWYDIGDIQNLRANFEGQIPLRLVYQMNCWGSELNSAWRTLGADTAVGSRFVNFFPTQFPEFVKQWKNGQTVQQALNSANTWTSRQVIQNALKTDMVATKDRPWADGEWGAGMVCPPPVVYGTSGQCAESYFTDRWGHTQTEWNSVNGDGWTFMLEASEKLVAGNASLTR